MPEAFLDRITETLETIWADGLWKTERAIVSPQGGHIAVAPSGQDMLNLCANNYLGLADHPSLIDAAKAAMDSHGYGMASVRFICGTQDLHRALETGLAEFSARTMSSSSRPVSTPMGACSSPSSAPRTRSCRMRSTTPRSSTA
jgi:7-keto-8-aminopelargonate synthetase-like enzyme